MSKTNLPSVTSDIPKDLRYFIDRLRESLDRKGANRFATVGELKNAGVIDTAPDGGVAPPVDDDDPTTLIPVLTPAKPEGVIAAGGYEFITVSWTTPSYYGHQYAEVYRVNGDTVDFTNQQLVATVPGFASVFSDYVGTGQTFSYRVRFVNINDVKGPYSDSATASTAIDVEEVLEVLNGQISSSELAGDLANLTDGLENKLVVTVGEPGGPATGFAIVGKTDESGNQVSQFAVAADQFFILPSVDYNQPTAPLSAPDGSVWRDSDGASYYIRENEQWKVIPVPFIVQSTPTNIDGVEVPAGVYINDGYIKNATITNAKIKDAAIDNAKIADATITSAKIGNLDAGKVTTGELKSFNFTNEGGTAGFLLQLGQREDFDSAGNPVTSQETVNFIIRAGNLNHPAMELKSDGTFEISGLTIRRFIQSLDYPNRGFKIDVNNNTFDFKDSNGRTIMTVGGLDSQAVRRSISQELDDLISDIGDAQSTADTANSTAETALDTANAAVDPVELGEALADKLDTSEFESLEGRLRAFAFLDKVTPDNIGAFFANAAIGTAYIGNAAVGTAQIAQAAIDTALIRNAAITSAKIEDLAVSTLKIGENAVTVPEGFTEPVSESVSLGVVKDIGPWLYLPNWDRGAGPTAIIISAQLQFMGDADQRQGTASIRVIAQWLSSTGSWLDADNYAKNNSWRSHSFQAQYGGQVSTMTHVPAPTANGVLWSRGCRIRVQGTFLANDGRSDFRSITKVSLSVLGSKR